MTRDETIYRLKNTAWLGSDEDREATERAVDMAVEAVKRQEPMNPVINMVHDADGSRRITEMWVESALLCPVCHTYFGEVYDEGYCMRCGQRLVQKRVRVIPRKEQSHE